MPYLDTKKSHNLKKQLLTVGFWPDSTIFDAVVRCRPVWIATKNDKNEQILSSGELRTPLSIEFPIKGSR
jgi:hypothetical protein